MTKINYSNFKEEEYEVSPAGSVEILPSDIAHNLLNMASNSNGQDLASAVSPVAAITNCISMSVDSISRCIAAICIEKEKTEQVIEEMKAKIVESKQQTERILIQEKEETKRLMITCESELKLKKIELEKMRNEYKSNSKDRKISHKEYTETLNRLEKMAYEIMKNTEPIRTAFSQETDFSKRETYLDKLDKVNKDLVEITKQLVSLRGMK